MKYVYIIIFRKRYNGELTIGPTGLGLLKEKSTSLFYYKKMLVKFKLITEQVSKYF